jgi:hypothetical protein
MVETTQSNRPAISSRREWLPWVAFAGGLVLVLIVFGVGSVRLADPLVRKSSGPFLGFALSGPLLVLSFCCCTASPFFTRLPLWIRFVIAFAGAAAVGVLAFISFVVLWVLHPPMV